MKRKFGGARRDRTDDLFHAMEALSQLSYGPTCPGLRRKRLARLAPETPFVPLGRDEALEQRRE